MERNNSKLEIYGVVYYNQSSDCFKSCSEL